MSQFLLLANPDISKIPEWVQVSDVGDEDFYSQVKTVVFAKFGSPMIATVKPLDQNFDDIFIQAQHALLEGKQLHDTLLHKTIMALESNVSAMAFWYGADFEDLDKVSDIQLVLDEIKRGLAESSGEAYVLFVKN